MSSMPINLFAEPDTIEAMMKNDMYEKLDKFPGWLVSELNERGWSQRELGRRANLSPTAISDTISGKTKPTWNFCASIAEALAMPPIEVFRIARLLPPLPPQTAAHRQLIEAITRLNENDAQLVLRVVASLSQQHLLLREKESAQPKGPGASHEKVALSLTPDQLQIIVDILRQFIALPDTPDAPEAPETESQEEDMGNKGEGSVWDALKNLPKGAVEKILKEAEEAARKASGQQRIEVLQNPR
jgi:transcriptional regulator with XRE-family HTH domain